MVQKERIFNIFPKKGVKYVDWIEICNTLDSSPEMGIEPVTCFSDPQPVSRLRSSSSGEPQREKIMRFIAENSHYIFANYYLLFDDILTTLAARGMTG